MKTTRRQILPAVALACALAFATIGAQADDSDTRIGRLSFENGQVAGFNFGDETHLWPSDGFHKLISTEQLPEKHGYHRVWQKDFSIGRSEGNDS
jgi:hypothetical protein